MGDILGAVTGSGNVEPIPAAELKAMLPESIGELKRSAIEAQGGEAMGIRRLGGEGSYVAGDTPRRAVDRATPAASPAWRRWPAGPT